MFHGLKLLTSLFCLCVISGYADEATQSYSLDTFVEKNMFQKRRGRRGRRGEHGHLGTTGPQGHQGSRGVRGPKGVKGPQGPTGPQGAQGCKGRTGPTGPQGSTGPAGSQGGTGPAGSSIFGYASYQPAHNVSLLLGSTIQLANPLRDTTGIITFSPAPSSSFTITKSGTYQISYFLRAYYQSIGSSFTYDTFAVNINGIPIGTTEIIPVLTPFSSTYSYVDSETRQVVVNINTIPSTVYLTAQNNSGSAFLANPGTTSDIAAYLFVQQLSPNQSSP